MHRLCAQGSNNVHEDRWETAPESYESEYNVFDDEWSYEPPKAELEYNPHHDVWEYNPELGVIVLPDTTEGELY